MKKEWLLMSVVVLGTLTMALLLLRSLAPSLLGIPIDLQVVEVSKTVPAFFENILRPHDGKKEGYLFRDPFTGTRARPLLPSMGTMGPNDLLGFRNRAIPAVADVIVIGDSQTYGNNSQLSQNWPSQMASALKANHEGTEVYNMSVGGWGAVQYLYVANYAPIFQPRAMVVAFYTGNDPLDSFKIAYNYKPWRHLIPDKSLSPDNLPSVNYPAPESEQWAVTFSDGVSTIFSPRVRYASNSEHPASRAGYAIMADVARRITATARKNQIEPVFLIIPTKELVYKAKIAADGFEQTSDYSTLIEAEESNIAWLAKEITELGGVHYVDVVKPLQAAAMGAEQLYPPDINGHPVARGYGVISEAVTPVVQKLLKKIEYGLALLNTAKGEYQPVLINDTRYWHFSETKYVEQNGWPPQETRVLTRRDIANMTYAGEINSVDREKFGPR